MLRADTIFGGSKDTEIGREGEWESEETGVVVAEGDGQKGAKAVLRQAGNECREIPGKQNKTQSGSESERASAVRQRASEEMRIGVEKL